MDFETEEFESIPLPDQLPKASDTYEKVELKNKAQTKNYSFLEETRDVSAKEDIHPVSTKSRTVQTLLNQNQDLSSRLSVSLKRNIELEQRLEENEDHFRHIKSKFETTADQNTILKEKTKHCETQIANLQQQSEKQDQKFEDLYNAYQEKIGYIQKLSYRLHRFLKYRSRIRGYIRPFLNRIKAETTEYKKHYVQSSQKILEQESASQKLKSKLQDAIDHIRKQKEMYEADQSELVSYHEARFAQLTQDYEKTKSSYEEAVNTNVDTKKQIETLREQEVELTNKSIYFERIYTDLKQNFETLQTASEEQKIQDTQRIKILESHTQQLSEKLNETIQYAQNLYNDHGALNDQYSSLQILFQENLNKNEDYKKRLASLEQMNRELSQSLLENRKKNDLLEEKLNKAEEDFKRKLESFQYRFQKPSDLARAVPAVGQKELLSKIQTLLSEIQTGNTKSEISIPHNQNNELISEHGEIGQTAVSSSDSSNT